MCYLLKKQSGVDQDKKAGNRHEEISEVAYCHSSERPFNYICISGVSWLIKAFEYYHRVLNVLNFGRIKFD